MMKTENAHVEDLARRIAANGASYLTRYQRALDRARGILARSELDKIEMLGSPLYPWEHGEPTHPPAARQRIVTASVEHGATGEGMTVQFMAGLAHGEVEFRRHMANWVGPHIANGAEIRTGTVHRAPHSEIFVSPTLQAILEEADRGGMAVLSYQAEIHLNYA
jgi:hypothetical protein